MTFLIQLNLTTGRSGLILDLVIEAGNPADSISCLKRAFGLARCTWRGLDHFKAYVWSSVVAHNLALFARLRPT